MLLFAYMTKLPSVYDAGLVLRFCFDFRELGFFNCQTEPAGDCSFNPLCSGCALSTALLYANFHSLPIAPQINCGAAELS